jgi:hypothetical protein
MLQAAVFHGEIGHFAARPAAGPRGALHKSKDICIETKALIKLRFSMPISDAECGHDFGSARVSASGQNIV